MGSKCGAIKFQQPLEPPCLVAIKMHIGRAAAPSPFVSQFPRLFFVADQRNNEADPPRSSRSFNRRDENGHSAGGKIRQVGDYRLSFRRTHGSAQCRFAFEPRLEHPMVGRLIARWRAHNFRFFVAEET